MPTRPTVFISDLHLSAEHPGSLRLFHRFLAEIGPHAGALYILGDLLDAWVGDDDLAAPFPTELAHRLGALQQAGVRACFLPGNRDFLVGDAFCQAAGLNLLPDPTVIDLAGTPTLLAHGDQYCTDDSAYQAYRAQVRTPAWQREFLAKPLEERRGIARAIRERSEQAKAGKPPEIMDVNPSAIADAFRAHGVNRIIHGHTHRPALHRHPVDGRPRERWVLPDWYETGGYLSCDAAGCRLVAFS